MTTPNVFPPDILQDIRDAKTAGEQSQAAAARRAPLTEASKGWKLGAMAAPDPDGFGPDDVHIYASGGQLRVASQGADIALQEFVRGSSVASPTFGSSALGTGADVNGAQYNDLREDVFSLFNVMNNLLVELRSRVIDP